MRLLIILYIMYVTILWLSLLILLISFMAKDLLSIVSFEKIMHDLNQKTVSDRNKSYIAVLTSGIATTNSSYREYYYIMCTIDIKITLDQYSIHFHVYKCTLLSWRVLNTFHA